MPPAGTSTNLTSRINGMTPHTHTNTLLGREGVGVKWFSMWFIGGGLCMFKKKLNALKKNPNASRPSEHPSVKREKNVKTFR